MKSYNDASSEAFLPGMAPSECGAETASHQPDSTTQSGWWVHHSVEQVRNSVGQPGGYRHQLMHGRRAIKSGVGADCARTFQQQADFLNARNHVTNDKS